MPDTAAHNKINPSELERVILCPPSLHLNAEYPKKDTAFSVEGTSAHLLAELAVRTLFKLPFTDYNNKAVIEGVTGEMFIHALRYAEFIRSRVDRIIKDTECDLKDISVLPEHKVRLERFIPNCSGVCDCAIVAPSRIVIVDFKYGVKKVTAQGSDLLLSTFGYNANTQLSAYALGILSALPGYRQKEIELIELYIYQPRAVGAAGSSSFTGLGVKTPTLIRFASKIKEQVELALNDDGDLCPGPHCRFCRHKDKCIEYRLFASGVVGDPKSPSSVSTEEDDETTVLDE